jgi:hypothetical protein
MTPQEPIECVAQQIVSGASKIDLPEAFDDLSRIVDRALLSVGRHGVA